MSRICICHETHRGGQAPGPHCPSAKLLAFLFDEVVESGDWIKAIAINGQTGVVTITSYSKERGENQQRFNLSGEISDAMMGARP